MTIRQNNNRNTVISCVIVVHIIGVIFLLSYPGNIVLSQVFHDPNSECTFLYCSFFMCIGMPAGVISLVLRLCFPASWKYKWRHNFFAVFNCVLGLFGWILCSFHTPVVLSPGRSGMMITAFLPGGGMLADIYLPKKQGQASR